MISLQEFLDGIQTPSQKLSVTKLREREDMWRALWSWLDDGVKRYIMKAGTMVRVMGRDYRGKVGELGEVKFTPSFIEVHVEEKVYNFNDGKYYYERKTIQFPWSAVAWLEGIHEQTPAEEVEQFEVGQIPEEELVT